MIAMNKIRCKMRRVISFPSDKSVLVRSRFYKSIIKTGCLFLSVLGVKSLLINHFMDLYEHQSSNIDLDISLRISCFLKRAFLRVFHV